MTNILFSADTCKNKYDFTIYNVDRKLRLKEYSVDIHYTGGMFKDGKPTLPVYNVKIVMDNKAEVFKFVRTEEIPHDVYDCEDLINNALLQYEMNL